MNTIRPKILIVDDQRVNLKILQEVLAETSAVLIVSLSGSQALALCLEHDFAVILLDVQMPDMDGYELLERLRMEEKTRHVPVMFLTAHNANLESQLRAYDLGAVDFIQKPINHRILLSKVNVFLELYTKKTQAQLIEQLARQKTQLETEVTKRKQIEEHLRKAHELLETQAVDQESRLQSTASRLSRDREVVIPA